jgi:hypothetical protein
LCLRGGVNTHVGRMEIIIFAQISEIYTILSYTIRGIHRNTQYYTTAITSTELAVVVSSKCTRYHGNYNQN